MDRELKRKIKRLWRDRLLVSIGGIAALGLAVVQLQTVLRHRSPQPSWTLDLSEAVETIKDEKSSAEEKGKAVLAIQRIANRRKLPKTVNLGRARARDLDRALDLALDLDLDRDLARDLARARARARDLDRALALDLDRDLDRDLDLDLDLARALGQAQKLEQELSVSQELSQALALSQELIQTLEQAQTKLKSPLIILVISAELEKEHGFQLYQGNELNDLVNKEPARARTFLTSAVLLTTSLLGLAVLLFLLSKLQLSYGLAPNSHLIAFLPEEYVAELGTLQRRMKKKKASVWQIRLRLFQEFLILLWVFYIQVQLENIGLPPSKDRSIDD